MYAKLYIILINKGLQMIYHQLYLITNNITGKKYVGQTLQSNGYENRFKAHIITALKSTTQRQTCYLHNSIKKYGPENFSIKLLLHNIPEEKIDFYECLWIKKLNTHYIDGNGYNMTYGGNGTKGYYFTDKVKTKIGNSISNWWKNLSEEEYKYECVRRSNYLKGLPKSEEHKKKLSECASKRTGEKNSFYGKHHSDSTKRHIGEMNSKSVGMFSIETGELVKTFSSLKDATDYLLLNNITTNKAAASRLSKICRGLGRSAYGYEWKFL